MLLATKNITLMILHKYVYNIQSIA